MALRKNHSTDTEITEGGSSCGSSGAGGGAGEASAGAGAFGGLFLSGGGSAGSAVLQKLKVE